MRPRSSNTFYVLSYNIELFLGHIVCNYIYNIYNSGNSKSGRVDEHVPSRGL